MEQVNIHTAKTHLSRLVEKVADGDVIIIAKNGKPKAKLIPYTTPAKSRVGFMKGRASLPDDFDTMFREEIEEMFFGLSDRGKK